MFEIKEVSRSAQKCIFYSVLCGSQNKQLLFPYTALTDWFLGAFTQLRKATITFVMPVRPQGTTRLPLVGFA
jgi:hypothetical protein